VGIREKALNDRPGMIQESACQLAGQLCRIVDEHVRGHLQCLAHDGRVVLPWRVVVVREQGREVAVRRPRSSQSKPVSNSCNSLSRPAAAR